MRRSVLTGLCIVLAATALITAAALAPGWKIDHSHSRVAFTVTKWGFVEVEGVFHDYAGTISFDQAHPENSRVEWRVKVASVETGEGARDHSLQAEDYFDAARFPELTFVSSRVAASGANVFAVTGTLTIRGVAKVVTIPVTYGGRHDVPDLGPMDIFQTTFTINRYDFGVKGGSVLGPVISKDVKISLIAAARP